MFPFGCVFEYKVETEHIVYVCAHVCYCTWDT